MLVASADGVGTKLKVAFMAGVHDTIGEDLVNHCVNDILVQGARPLFFLDYLATGALSPDVVEQIVSGMARACVENGCALLGGETAEMPGFYAAGEYDVAGFIVGLVSRASIVDGRDIAAGDQLVALPSSGLHTNGYSLARRIAFESPRPDVATATSRSLARPWVKHCLRPHRSYCAAWPLSLAAGASRGWRTSPEVASPRTCRGSCLTVSGFHSTAAAGPLPPALRLAAAGRRCLGPGDVPRVQHGGRDGSRGRSSRHRRPRRRAPGLRRGGLATG